MSKKKNTVLKEGEVIDQGPLHITPEKDKVIESIYKKVIMIQHEISLGIKEDEVRV